MVRVEPYGEYMVCFSGEDVTAVEDLFEITAPSDAVVVIHKIEWAQSGASQTDEILAHSFKRYTSDSTSGSGGSSVTPQSTMSSGGVAAGSTAERNNSTQITGGTLKQEILVALNAMRSGSRDLLGRNQIVLSPSERFVWSLNDAPTSTLTTHCSVYFSEIGG